jgi:hypothetical protein
MCIALALGSSTSQIIFCTEELERRAAQGVEEDLLQREESGGALGGVFMRREGSAGEGVRATAAAAAASGSALVGCAGEESGALDHDAVSAFNALGRGESRSPAAIAMANALELSDEQLVQSLSSLEDLEHLSELSGGELPEFEIRFGEDGRMDVFVGEGVEEGEDEEDDVHALLGDLDAEDEDEDEEDESEANRVATIRHHNNELAEAYVWESALRAMGGEYESFTALSSPEFDGRLVFNSNDD